MADPSCSVGKIISILGAEPKTGSPTPPQKKMALLPLGSRYPGIPNHSNDKCVETAGQGDGTTT